jgi:micrococcal nuclease
MGVIAATVCLSLHCFPSNVYVYDGDTFRVDQQWYRIANIDAPEIRGDCVREKVFAQAARLRLEGLLRGRTINVKALGFDKWERELARVSVEDSDIGEALLKDGLARKWTKKWDHKPEPWCQS